MEQKLAIYGGDPVREELLPYGQQWIDEEDIQAVVDVLKSDFLTTGPKVREFEEKIADYVGAEYAVAFSNGTAALHAACFSAGIKEGDEVITTPMTFVASANCILYQGATPVFSDIDPDTYNIDPKSIEKKITNKTKVILPVDFCGQPANLDKILSIAKNHGLLVITDGAHSLGAKYKDKRVGSITDMTVFSLHPVKHITTGEGGIVTTNNKYLYERLLLFRTHGITREDYLISKNEGYWYYEQLELGYNYRLTDMQCALGISQLKKINKFIEKRREIVNMYNEGFKGNELITLPYQQNNTFSSWHLYIIQLKLNKIRVGRKEIFEALRAENIGVNVHYIPVYYHPYYRRLGYEKGLCPGAEELYEKIITLPLFPKMGKKDVLDVVQAIDKVLNYYKE